jgi:PadR family transcriptional regulator, regulatory protein PadR
MASINLCHGPEPRVHGLIQALLLLLLKEREDHGYQLVQRLGSEIPEEMAPAPTVVYRLLRDLERIGSVRAELQPGAAGPARKVYTLTSAGEVHLEDWVATVKNRIELLQTFLRRCDQVYRAGAVSRTGPNASEQDKTLPEVSP